LGPGADGPLREALTRMLDPDPDRRAASIVPLLARLDRQNGASARGTEERRDGRGSARDQRSGGSRAAWNADQGFFLGGGDPAWEDEVRRWAQHAEEQAREARWRAREERERIRERARTHRRDRRAERRGRRPGRPLHGPPLFFAILGLDVAILVVSMVLG